MQFTATHIDYYKSPLGKILLTSNEDFLVGLSFATDNGSDDNKEIDSAISGDRPAVLIDTHKWLDLYFAGKDPELNGVNRPKTSFSSSSFNEMVWQILLTIPYGKTMTYKEIAEKVAKIRSIPKMSAQAVGGAVGRNPISIIAPCHRVVSASGALTGYSGGLKRKAKLLALEQSHRRYLWQNYKIDISHKGGE